MQCRMCGACCIAMSISSAIPGCPCLVNGKPAGLRCPYLMENNKCELFNKPNRPKICGLYKPVDWICGINRSMAMENIAALEAATKPEK